MIVQMDDGAPLWLRPKARVAREHADVKLEQSPALTPPLSPKTKQKKNRMSYRRHCRLACVIRPSDRAKTDR